MCECDYYAGGCMITVGAPKGYKCRCRYFFLWSCNGHAIRCGQHETCPENCATYQCCNHGGGDCGAYELIWNDTVISNWSEMTAITKWLRICHENGSVITSIKTDDILRFFVCFFLVALLAVVITKITGTLTRVIGISMDELVYPYSFTTISAP